MSSPSSPWVSPKLTGAHRGIHVGLGEIRHLELQLRSISSILLLYIMIVYFTAL